MTLFNHDWWFGGQFAARVEDAKDRCARARFPSIKAPQAGDNREFQTFLKEIEARTIVYVRDGFSYELKELIDTGTTAALTFECMPAEEAYKVGSFVVTIPYEEVARIEIFAVHSKEKPEDMLSIRGFGGSQPPPGKKVEGTQGRAESSD
jgi:hypothetical protein